MSVALENAQLFDETQRLLKETEQRNAELAIINSVQEGLASKLDMQAIYDLVGDKIWEITQSQIVVINSIDLKNEIVGWHYVRERGQRMEIPPRPFTPLNKYIRTMTSVSRPRLRLTFTQDSCVRAIVPAGWRWRS